MDKKHSIINSFIYIHDKITKGIIIDETSSFFDKPLSEFIGSLKQDHIYLTDKTKFLSEKHIFCLDDEVYIIPLLFKEKTYSMDIQKFFSFHMDFKQIKKVKDLFNSPILIRIVPKNTRKMWIGKCLKFNPENYKLEKLQYKDLAYLSFLKQGKGKKEYLEALKKIEENKDLFSSWSINFDNYNDL